MKNITSKRTPGQRSTAQKALFVTLISVGVLIVAAGSLYALEKARITNLVKDPLYVSDEEKAEEATKNDPTTGNKDDGTVIDGVDSNKNPDDIPESTSMAISIKSAVQTSGVIKANVSITNNAN